MDWILKPVLKISGTVIPPADKSITHRAIMLGALADGESLIENYLAGEDCLSTLKAFEKMGVRSERDKVSLKIHGVGIDGLKPPSGSIDAGNSGTTVRLLSGILACQDFTSTIIGDSSLSKRPMQRIIVPLELMGAKINARENNFLPLEINGNRNIKPIDFVSTIASAQVKSCVLFAGLRAKGVTSFTEPSKSRDHTERMLAAAGAEILTDEYSVRIKGPAVLNPQRLMVPADISSAAFFLVAGAICRKARIELKNVGINPTRDGIVEVLIKMGARLLVSNKKMISGEPVADMVVENSDLKAIEIGSDIIPRLIDEIPILVLAATQAHGTTVISGAGELRVKESDRLKTISTELNKMGAAITEKEDGLIIHGPSKLKGTEVESYGDHRVAMTLAVAGLIAEGETKVRNVECVETSFPGFLSDLTNLTT